MSPAPVDLALFPAASSTDSPARGIPRHAPREGLVITGGFGDHAVLQYFALTGAELRVLVEALMDDVHGRIQNDLRFNEAIVYPQVTARVVIEITGFASDTGFLVDKVLPPTHEARTRTPTEIARDVADEVCFVVLSERRETDDAGNSVAPPDQVRQDLGLARPGKHVIRAANGLETWADV